MEITKVVLTGQLRAGKDYAAELLGCNVLAVAEPLYETCTALMGGCNKENPQHRRLLQLLGAWGRGSHTESAPGLPTMEEVTKIYRTNPSAILSPKHTSLEIDWGEFGKRPDFWINVVVLKAKALLKENPHQRLAIPNGRFENEIFAFQRLGFLHLHITCTEETRLKRPGAANIGKDNENDATEEYAKHLDQHMHGPCVLWNDPEKPLPENRGFQRLEDIANHQSDRNSAYRLARLAQQLEVYKTNKSFAELVDEVMRKNKP